MGKSKLCLEYLTSHLGFYIYCGGALGEANESECLDYIKSIGSRSEPEITCEIFFKYALIQLHCHFLKKELSPDTIGAFSKQFFPHSMETRPKESSVFWLQVMNETNQFMDCRQKYLEILEKTEEWVDVKKVTVSDAYKYALENQTKHPTLLNDLAPFMSLKNNVFEKLNNATNWIGEHLREPILFVFDEGNELTKIFDGANVSSFRIIRRAVKDASLHKYVCVCFVGTSAKLANFAPSDQKHSSNRVPSEITELFPPFVAISPGDLEFQPEECLPTDQTSSMYEWILQKDTLPISLIKMGRPLWHSQYQAALSTAPIINESKNAIKSVLKLAEEKLFFYTGNDLIAAKLALFLSRLPFTVSPSEIIADTMMASNMAYCLYVSQQRDRLFSSYLSEPILAAAAAKVLRENYKAIDAAVVLANSFVYGKVNAGHMGEFVAGLILLGAYDESCLGQNLSPLQSVKLQSWMKALFGSALWSDAWKQFSANSFLKEEECFGDGIVCYNHIVRLKKSMKMKDIHRAIHRMYGIWGMPSQEAFDFCLPIVLNDGGVAGIYVQVKNCKVAFSDSAAETIFKKMIENASEEELLGPEMVKKSVFILFTFDQALTVPLIKVLIVDGCICICSNGFSKDLYPNILGNRDPSSYGALKGLLYGDTNIYKSVMTLDKSHRGSSLEYGEAVLAEPLLIHEN